ncbi:hypothetical protein BHM03_00017730 [Ensete ventricosum]|nr:hypothetical protein BHM03_00017730 [Ensete ventricosum]
MQPLGLHMVVETVDQVEHDLEAVTFEEIPLPGVEAVSIMVEAMGMEVGHMRHQGMVVDSQQNSLLIVLRPRFSLPSCKALYCSVHIGPVADRYVDRPLPGGTAKIGRRRSIEEEKMKRRKKYLAVILAYALLVCPRRSWVDREPSPPARHSVVSRPSGANEMSRVEVSHPLSTHKLRGKRRIRILSMLLRPRQVQKSYL